MKTLLAILLSITIISCALKPAPITTLDVRATLGGLTPEARSTQAVQIVKDITERKRVLHDYVDVPWPFWVLMPITTGIVYACYTPARRASRDEIKALEEKEAIVSEMLATPSAQVAP